MKSNNIFSDASDFSKYVDIETGLIFSGGNIDFYKELLGMYVKQYDDKSSAVISSYNNKDWEAFTIAIHSIKGNSRTMGILKLGDLAEKLEYAAKENDIDYIDNNYEEALSLYAEVIENINKFINNN